MSRTIVIMGHYGSGKTEFSVNLAMSLREEYEKLALLDMDIANPYFRSRERQKQLQDEGISVIFNEYGYDIAEDLPAITAKVRAPLENPEFTTIVDVGGNDSGARII
ncbi:MAG: ATP-binding protein, partial [Firmicutes bacterium]|nr:ATP-binding protein [Bacillota bacterium]